MESSIIGSRIALFLIYALIGVVLFRRPRLPWYEYIPSGFWLVLMVIPYTLQLHYFDPTAVWLQTAGIGIFSVAIFIGDAWPLRTQRRRNSFSPKQLFWVGVGLLGLSVALQIHHLWKMPNIPLADLLFENASEDHLQMEREAASKLLNVPLGLMYLYQSTIYFMLPIAVAIFASLANWGLVILSLVIGVLYSLSTLAKTPVMVFSLISVSMLWFQLSHTLRSWITRTATAITLGVGSMALYFLLTHPLSIFNFRATGPALEEFQTKIQALPSAPRILTIGDHARLLRSDRSWMGEFQYKDLPSTVEKRYNYLVYRALVVPSEVSHFWYVYFPKIQGDYLGFYGLTPASRAASDFQHPANKVGQWAYLTRHPDYYLDSVRAYCSIDADAYARWGVIGLIVVALGFLLFRVLWKQLVFDDGFGRGINLTGLILMGVYLPQASFASLLVVSGLLGFFLIMLGFHLVPQIHRRAFANKTGHAAHPAFQHDKV